MKGMALQIIAELMIAIVAILIVVSLMGFYSEQIKDFFNGIFYKNDYSCAEIINSTSFSTSQLKTSIMACWDKCGKKYQNKICYVLTGDVSGVDSNALKNSLDSPLSVDISKFDKSKKTTMIKTMNKGVIVEST
jgi:predicted DNA-binding protein YlxM (UPF0122 family)